MRDPIQLSEIATQVSKGNARKYYRFRPAKFYGGIATADCVGCNLRCVYCWAWNIVNKPSQAGEFYSPEEVAEKLTTIANKHGFSRIRMSGNEPTLNKEHLLSLIQRIPNNLLFILETNGILIGHDRDYARDLSKFKNLHVRVSLKGSDSQEFSKLTGAKPEFFSLQLKALENLEKHKVSYHPAVIGITRDLNGLRERLREMRPDLPESLELEPLIEYPQVLARLKKINF